MNKSRTIQSQKIDENLMFGNIFQWKPVLFRNQNQSRFLYDTFLLNGILWTDYKNTQRKQNSLICIKKNINNEGGRHLWNSNVTPDSYVFPDMSLLQGCRNGFQSGQPWNTERYLLLTPWLTCKKNFWILDKKALQNIDSHDTSNPLSQFCWPCIVIYHMKLASVLNLKFFFRMR